MTQPLRPPARVQIPDKLEAFHGLMCGWLHRGARASTLDFENQSQYKGCMRNLAQLPPGARARIDGFRSDLRPEVGRRLRELGFVDGNVVRCVRRAPFGGPRVYAVSGAAFALEMDVAAHVLLGPADNDDGAR